MAFKRVLVVDDEAALLLAFKKLLHKPNLIVDTSDNIEDAKRKIKQYIYDVVIADLRLSGTMDKEGYEIIRYTKEISPKSTIALITAYGNSGIEQQARKLGADFYFEKPVSINNLLTIINSAG